MKHSSSLYRPIMFMIAVLLLTQSGEAQEIAVSACGTGVHKAEASGTVSFPQDRIFCPVFADPKEPRTFASYLRGRFRTLDDPSGQYTNIGSVGLGDSFGLVRWSGSRPGDGVQLDVFGSIFAQFDLGASSNDLINADYIVGLPLTFRRGGFSTRLKVYHQSSHLGDEYLLRDQEIQRENLSFESVELLLSGEVGPLRAYAGTEWLFRREPESLAEQVVHGGIELRSGGAAPLRLVSGVDVKGSQQHDWSPAISVRAGIELGRAVEAGHPARPVALLVELYDGPSPYGQFFQDDIRYIGVGLHVGF